MANISQLLKNHSLRLTTSRSEILQVMLEDGSAMSQREIEVAMTGDCDRVTIYRTLSTFLEKGIIHKVLDDTGAMKYALCPETCQEDHSHHHDHVHFKCEKCGTTSCIDQVQIPVVDLPNGYVLREVNMLLEGVCAKCS